MSLKPPEEVVLARLLRLNAVLYGIMGGLIAGVGLFVATNWLVIKGGEEVGPHLGLLRHFYPGYEVTFVGSLIGFAYAFATGFIIAYSLARIYNFLLSLKSDKGADS